MKHLFFGGIHPKYNKEMSKTIPEVKVIDPDTLYPGKLWRAVTVVCPDSGLTDALSTALFLLPMEEGQKLLDACESTAMWVDAEGNMYYSEGFQDLIRT